MKKLHKILITGTVSAMLMAANCIPAFAANQNFAFVFAYAGEKQSTTPGVTKSYDGDPYAYVTTKTSLPGYGTSDLFSYSGNKAYFRVARFNYIPTTAERVSNLLTMTGYYPATVAYYSGMANGGMTNMLIAEADGNIYNRNLVGTWCP